MNSFILIDRNKVSTVASLNDYCQEFCKKAAIGHLAYGLWKGTVATLATTRQDATNSMWISKSWGNFLFLWGNGRGNLDGLIVLECPRDQFSPHGWARRLATLSFSVLATSLPKFCIFLGNNEHPSEAWI